MVKNKMGITKEAMDSFNLIMMPGSYLGLEGKPYIHKIVPRMFESK